MGTMARFGAGLVGAVTLLAPVAGQAQQQLEFDFEGRKNFAGVSGERAVFDARFYVVLHSLNRADTGVTGWSYGVVASGGVTITGITEQGTVAADAGDLPPGVRNGGFSLHELTTEAEPLSECDGFAGAVSTVVLSFDRPITLPPKRRLRTRIATIRATVSGVAPDHGGFERIGELRFVDGCRGSGDPIFNRVTVGQQSFTPGRRPYEVRFVRGLEDCVARRCADRPGSLELLFEGARTTAEPDSGCPQNPARLEVPGVPAGELRSTDVFVRLVSRGLESGVQGWALSLAVCTGDIEITDARNDGTVSASVEDDPPGLVNVGFSFVERTLAGSFESEECFRMPGVVQAIVLSLQMPLTLEPDSDHRVLALTVATVLPVPAPIDGKTPGEIAGELQFKDGCQGSGSPVDNVATINGATVRFDCRQAVRIAFLSALPAGDRTFLRCDPNDDARRDLADAVWIINELFRGGLESSCEVAMDCNGDGGADVTDALYAARSFFGLESPVPGGGSCETAAPEVCEVASSACP